MVLIKNFINTHFASVKGRLSVNSKNELRLHVHRTWQLLIIKYCYIRKNLHCTVLMQQHSIYCNQSTVWEANMLAISSAQISLPVVDRLSVVQTACWNYLLSLLLEQFLLPWSPPHFAAPFSWTFWLILCRLLPCHVKFICSVRWLNTHFSIDVATSTFYVFVLHGPHGKRSIWWVVLQSWLLTSVGMTVITTTAKLP